MPAQPSPAEWQGVAWSICGAGALWMLGAALTFFTAPGLQTFGRLLVIWECVGTLMVVCILLLMRIGPLARVNPKGRWFVVASIAIPAAVVVGRALAFAILGDPIHFMSQEHDALVPIAFALLVAGFGALFLTTHGQLSAEIAMKLDARRLVVESELRLLRAQLEPHMMFNTLANLRSLLREDAGQAEAMIDQLVTYLRSAMTASCAESTTLFHEFDQLRAYLEIMTFRMGPRLTFRLDLPAELAHVLVPPMLLQPLVENAIRHGLEPKVGVGRVDVLARYAGGAVEISVTDSGLGLPCDIEMTPKDATDSGLHGLSHLRARLNAAYGARASLQLRGCKPCGARAVVIIPA